MKTTILKYITVTFAAGAMLLAGCNDLDQEPTNKFTDKAFWTSPLIRIFFTLFFLMILPLL